MEIQTDEMAEIAKQEEKNRLIRSYEQALDIQFGIKKVKDEEKRVIFEEAKGANRIISMMAGEPIILDAEEARKIKSEHPLNFGKLLGEFKNGIEVDQGYIKMEGEAAGNVVELGRKASLQLFGPTVPNIQFV